MLTRSLLLLVLTFVPVAGQAQPQWDVAATAGLFAGYTPRTDGRGYQDTWFHSALGGVIVGRHLTPHLKLEVDAAITRAGRQYRERLTVVPGYSFPYPVGSEVSTSVRSLGAAVSWQFRDNEWVHPFIAAGVSTDFDRVSTRTWEQYFYSDPRSGPPLRTADASVEGPTTTRAVRALLGGGAKVYVSERAFIRTDARWSFHRSRQNLAFRLGIGVDL